MRRRAHVFYSGRVHGVGFRFTACGVAQSFAVSGFVMNVPDGRVELVMEGEENDVRGCLSDLSRTMDRFIRDDVVTWEEDRGEFSCFTVKY